MIGSNGYSVDCPHCFAAEPKMKTEEYAAIALNTRTQSWPPMQTGEPPKPGWYLVRFKHVACEHSEYWDGKKWCYCMTPDRIIGWWPLPPMGE
jgi:hypothetical protein